VSVKVVAAINSMNKQGVVRKNSVDPKFINVTMIE